MLRGLVALVWFGLIVQSGCTLTERRHRGLRSKRAVRRKGHQQQQPVPQGWSLPPLSKIFRGSAKTVDALEDNVKKLKSAVRDLRGKNLEDAKEAYAGFTQALTIDDEQDQKLEVDNEEVEKKINAMQLSNKAAEERRDNMVKENAKLTKQLEELKKTVNAQVEGLEGILKSGIDVEPATEPAVSQPAPVDFQARAKNVAMPQAISLIQTSKKDSEDDDDEESDDDEDASSALTAAPVCRCRTPCSDEGWGMWCYLQTGNCRVKEQCEMGGAANACVADDPGGPWTRCSNLLATDVAGPAQPATNQPQLASATSTAGTVQPAAQQTFSVNAQPVKDILVKLMTQVDDIRTEDQQSAGKMREIYQSESTKMQSKRTAILEKQKELATRLREVKGDSAKLAAQVEHLEEVNRSLHTQLHRLQHFLSSASSELSGSMESEDRIATAALQVSKKDDENDDDSDDDSDDN